MALNQPVRLVALAIVVSSILSAETVKIRPRRMVPTSKEIRLVSGGKETPERNQGSRSNS